MLTIHQGLYVVIISCTRFRVNPQIVAWMSSNSMLGTGAIYEVFKWQQRDSNPQPISL